MNAINVNEQAMKAFDAFVNVMTNTAPRTHRKFSVTERDGELINFDLDNYKFTLTWTEEDINIIGRSIMIPEYQLCTWYSTYGSRYEPPEDVDVTLVTSRNIYDCIKSAFESVAKDEIRQALEATDCEMSVNNQTEEGY